MMKGQNAIDSFNFLQHLQTIDKRYHGLPYVVADSKSLSKAERTAFVNYFYTVGLFYSGDARIKVGTKEYSVKKGSLITIGPGETCEWVSGSPPASDVVFFYEDVFLHSFNATFFYSLEFFCPDAFNMIEFDDAELEKMKALFNTIRLFRDNVRVFSGILYSILMYTQQKYWAQYCNGKKELSKKEQTVALFRSLVAKKYAEHKDVQYYARAMHITPKQLSQILLEQTGHTAKKWIERHLMQEAKYLLSYSDLSVKEIGFRLGFIDPSHFVKAFKNYEGLLPGVFRTKQQLTGNSFVQRVRSYD